MDELDEISAGIRKWTKIGLGLMFATWVTIIIGNIYVVLIAVAAQLAALKNQVGLILKGREQISRLKGFVEGVEAVKEEAEKSIENKA